VEDVTALPREPWARLGGRGTFIQLQGTFESLRGIYVAEIPGGESLEPERHLYEEQVFVLQGRGACQVWQKESQKVTFEWGEGSVFAFPRNLWHRLYNVGREPVVLMAVTAAPEVINALDDIDFVFNCDYDFMDLDRNQDYFSNPGLHTQEGWYNENIWHTNFIPDARRHELTDLEQKVSGGQLTGYRMGPRFPQGHISEWPTGRYHKAHYHEPGSILLGLDGEGYVLAWPAALGPHPYQDGLGDQVYRLNWRRNSIYTPPNAYFHQHFNSGRESAKHIAVYGAKLPLGVHDLNAEDGSWRGHASIYEGGTLIEYEDEDPQIRQDFEATLRANGLESTMPPVTYRPRPAGPMRAASEFSRQR
jgi:quercetin dioxygenase-like cupin family protein